MVHTEKLIPLTAVFLQEATAPHVVKKKKKPPLLCKPKAQYRIPNNPSPVPNPL